jgi:hypothetical protein
MDDHLAPLFTVLDALPAPVDDNVPFQETPVETQGRLLEEHAQYRFDAALATDQKNHSAESGAK